MVSRYSDVPADEECVILLDTRGRPSGTAPKRSVHGTDTPLHLGFSCHLVDRSGRLLLTRRAAHKVTWPGVWSNACCGHPQPGETLRGAVTRRLRDELGVDAEQIGMAVADFTYRAVMANGVVEHEVCPVIVGRIDGEPTLNPAEVDDACWVDWPALCERARREPQSLSPWSVAQVAELQALPMDPVGWTHGLDAVGLDDPVGAEPSWTAPDRRRVDDPFEPIQGPVEEILARYVAHQTAALVDLDPALAAVAGEIGELIAAGGKRLRPAFVYWGHRATGAGHDSGVIDVAAAVEMLHTFALLHDDVMDRATCRRGRRTAQQAFVTTHRDDGLRGDGDWFGTSAAILAGDLAFVWADDLLDRAPLPAAAIARARRVFTALRVEVMAGQYLDLRLDRLTAADPSTAQRVALLKSGRYTVTRPLAIGQAIVGAEDTPTARALATYGDALGLAFQMRDDVLGLLGEPERTGKSCTSDLREGKRTVLISRALALATPAQRAVLEAALGDAELDEGSAERCRTIVVESGALGVGRDGRARQLRRRRRRGEDAARASPRRARGAVVEHRRSGSVTRGGVHDRPVQPRPAAP